MSEIKKDTSQEIEEMFSEDDKSTETKSKTKKKSKGPKVFLTIILILVLLFVILLVVSKVTNWDVLKLNKAGQTEIAKASDWQAVFLTNGQVYFGKLKNVNGNYPTLEDVYYLQVQNVPIQPAEPAGGDEEVQPAVETQEQVILVKFGTELHRPTDKMNINKDHILMYEDLSEGSGVVDAINGYKEAQEAEE